MAPSRLMKPPGAFDFIQSPRDSPCRVRAGAFGRRGLPLLCMSKWDGEVAMEFRTEFESEYVRDIRREPGQTVLCCGDRQHVYRRLDEGGIEYDILLAEIPRSPFFKIPLDMPRGLSFHKQGLRHPERVSGDIKGSYAVYWKRRNGAYKTGKFCHIFRPKIIDAAGRWHWAELDFDGEALLIRADEDWLKTARYPVTVDPRLGYDSVGVNTWAPWDVGEPEDRGRFMYEMGMGMQKVIPDSPVTGECTAAFYCYRLDGEANGTAVLYGGSTPTDLVSSGAPLMDLNTPSGSDPSWKSCSFTVPESQEAGSSLWLGILAYYFHYPVFDEVEGADFRMTYPSDFTTPPGTINTSIYSYSGYLLSQYMDYINVVYNYAALTETIYPDDERAFTTEYKREASSEMAPTGVTSAARGLIRLVSSAGGMTDTLTRTVWFQRLQEAGAGIVSRLSRVYTAFISLVEGLSFWDVIAPSRAYASEELTLYSPVTLTLELQSPI